MKNRHRLLNPVLVLAVLVPLMGCATRTTVLLHKTHRVTYTISDDELKGAQFYLGKEILGRRLSDSGEVVSSDDVFLVSQGTPGVVTAAYSRLQPGCTP